MTVQVWTRCPRAIVWMHPPLVRKALQAEHHFSLSPLSETGGRSCQLAVARHNTTYLQTTAHQKSQVSIDNLVMIWLGKPRSSWTAAVAGSLSTSHRSGEALNTDHGSPKATSTYLRHLVYTVVDSNAIWGTQAISESIKMNIYCNHRVRAMV